MKKLSKLVLKREVVARLESSQMNHLLGRGNVCYTGRPLITWNSIFNVCPPKTNIEECPYYSAFGGEYGCNAVTCGWAYTCNG
jgi:natural product precursor